MTYLGIDVLDAPNHNMREAIAESFTRSGTLLDPVTGKRDFDDHASSPTPTPTPTRNFQWTCFDRTACNALRTFLDARKGRVVPFWVPTFCWDLQLAQDVLTPSFPYIFVKNIGYGASLFPSSSRQYLAIFPKGSAMLIRKITGTSVSSSTVEQLTLDTAPGIQWFADRTVLSFLTLCRLAEDLTPIHWNKTDQCEATIRFQELPSEVPA